MTIKSTLIMPITLLTALAAGVLVHDRLRTKTLSEGAGPAQTVSIAPAELAASAPVSVQPGSSPPPVSQDASVVDHLAPTQTASIAPAEPAALAPVIALPNSASTPASPEPQPPRRMTASQAASLDAWIIKTYLTCWKPAAQQGDANRYVAQVRLRFKPDGSLLTPPKLVNPPSDPAQKPQAKRVLQAVKACNPLPMPAEYRSFYEQWKTKTIFFDPQVAER